MAGFVNRLKNLTIDAKVLVEILKNCTIEELTPLLKEDNDELWDREEAKQNTAYTDLTQEEGEKEKKKKKKGGV